jgi:tetratricopeptide (TPR) repeat protein
MRAFSSRLTGLKLWLNSITFMTTFFMQKSLLTMLSLIVFCALCSSAQAQTAPGAISLAENVLLPPYRTPKSIQDHPNINLSTSASPCLDDYFEFVDSVHTDVSGGDGEKTRAWTEPEKMCVRKTLRFVFSRLPGLVVHAASGRKIALLRASKIHAHSNVYGSFNAPAATLPEGLIFSERYFTSVESDRLLEGVIHELVHCADFAGQIEFSKEWVAFANPTISEVRWRSQLSHPQLYSGTFAERKWVSKYGTTNLREALAEYYSHAVLGLDTGYFHVSPAFEQFAKRLACPSKEELQFENHFKNARVFTQAKMHDEAIRELEQARQLFAHCPSVYAFLASNYYSKAQYRDCLNAAEQAFAQFGRVGIFANEPNFLFLCGVKAQALECTGKYKEAISILDKLLLSEPSPTHRAHDHYLRGLCYEKLGMLSEAASDYYDQKYGRKGTMDFRGLCDDHGAVLATIDQRLGADSTRADAYEMRARYEEYVGDMEKDPEAKKRHYRLALTDLLAARGCFDAKPNHVLICIGKLYLKLDNFAEAKLAYERARTLDTKDLETRIFNLKLLQLRGRYLESHRQFASILSQLKCDYPIEVAPLGDFLTKLFDNIS